MSRPGAWGVRLLAGMLLVGLAGCGSGPAPDVAAPPQNEFVFGLLMVGPANDHGWSQAHFEAGRYVEKNVPGARMVYVDKVNPSDRPGTTPAQLADDLLARGARLVIFNSDDMKDGALEFARAHRDIPVIHISGDSAWPEGRDYARLPNLANIMGRMEHGAAMAGFAAAMTTRTGRIGYLGPLINDETRRLAAATYLGARHAWTQVLKRNPGQLRFKVSWIGFWFNIPGVTLDPTDETRRFIDGGADVVISGIDTTEALVVAGQRAAEGEKVWAIPYDYKEACAGAPEVCLGVPYFNWGPAYVQVIEAVKNGTYEQFWNWNPPYFADLNNQDLTAVGWVNGDGLTEEQAAQLEEFIAMLAETDPGVLTAENIDDPDKQIGLWVGPLALQDGTVLAEEGEIVPPRSVWYLEQLLQGMTGDSSAQ